MLVSFIYLVFVSLLKLLICSGRPAQVKDIDLIVLPEGCENPVPSRCGPVVLMQEATESIPSLDRP